MSDKEDTMQVNTQGFAKKRRVQLAEESDEEASSLKVTEAAKEVKLAPPSKAEPFRVPARTKSELPETVTIGFGAPPSKPGRIMQSFFNIPQPKSKMSPPAPPAPSAADETKSASPVPSSQQPLSSQQAPSSSQPPASQLDSAQPAAGTEPISSQTPAPAPAPAPASASSGGGSLMTFFTSSSSLSSSNSAPRSCKDVNNDPALLGQYLGRPDYDPVAHAGWRKGERVPYSALTAMFAACEATTKRLQVIAYVSDYFRSVIALSPEHLAASVYLCINAVAPAYENKELGVGDQILQKALIEATGGTLAAVKARLKETGDLGVIAEEARAKQKTLLRPAKLTVPTVFARLKEIAETTGMKSADKKKDAIKTLLVACVGHEARFLVRALQGSLRIHLALLTVIRALARAVVLTPPEYPAESVAAARELRDKLAAEEAAKAAAGGAGGNGKATASPSADDDDDDAASGSSSDSDNDGDAVDDDDDEEASSSRRKKGRKSRRRLADDDDLPDEDEEADDSSDKNGSPTTPVTPADGLEAHAASRAEAYREHLAAKKAARKTASSAKPKSAEEIAILRAHSQIEAAYNEGPSIDRLVAALLRFPPDLLHTQCFLTPGVPIKVMLGKPAGGAEEVLAKFDAMDITLEYKYDGQRAQIHRLEDGRTLIYSRNMENNTSMYPDVIMNLPRATPQGVTSYILDAEVVAWDTKSKQILPFQVLSTRKRKDAKEEDISVHVAVYAFDLLYLNGTSYMRDPFALRRAKLHETFTAIEGVFGFAQYLDTRDPEDMMEFMAQSCRDSCEGLMVKPLYIDAAYVPDKRKWIKVKKDYLEGVGDTLDLVPIGAWFGKGKRTGVYGSFLMACFDPDEETYQTIARVATGFSEADLAKALETLKPKERAEPPLFYRFSKQLSPDVWFDPSVVWELLCADLSLSPCHLAGVGRVHDTRGIAMRFPRFMRLREDKDPEMATTSEQVAEMYCNQDTIKNAGVSHRRHH